MIYDVVIIGGGPSGLMAANQLEAHGLNYMILEKNDKPAKKLLLTGGKRCNVTNNLNVESFIESLNMKHRRFLYHALKTFGPNQIIAFFEERGLKLLLEQNLKYFPETQKSQSVLDALMRDIKTNHISFLENVKSIEPLSSGYQIRTSKDIYQAKHVIVATGSKAYPTTGSSGDGVIFAQHLGINTIPFTPAETHIYSKQIKDDYKDLQGISINHARLKIEGSKKPIDGGVLFTHFGLSGPAILHASEMIAKKMHDGDTYVTFALSEYDDQFVLERLDKSYEDNEMLITCLEDLCVKRIAKLMIERLGLISKRMKEYSKKDRERISDMLLRFQVKVDQVEDIERAFVNAGGIDVSELDPKSMMSRKHPGLYFIGEVTDLQGPIGGFNLTIAFATGYLAAHHIINI